MCQNAKCLENHAADAVGYISYPVDEYEIPTSKGGEGRKGRDRRGGKGGEEKEGKKTEGKGRTPVRKNLATGPPVGYCRYEMTAGYHVRVRLEASKLVIVAL